MRFKEFIKESTQLLEINMSPTSLRSLAASIGATAGMEFEMIVPNAKTGGGGGRWGGFGYRSYVYGGGGGEANVEDVAHAFSKAIGKPINYSDSYHGATRAPGRYVVEPDGSLDPDDSNDAGLEFVSPPMPVDEMLTDLNKVVDWAKEYGCYTNNSTGLHMNVSVPALRTGELDYVKLAILLGDEYVLNQFGRLGNTYTASALEKVRDRIKHYPEEVARVLAQMKSHLGAIASRVIHSTSTSKYTSINVKEGYIEFRSPGGDWLEEDLGKLESTLLRFVVALDAACDPEKYRKEYLTKLYKLLAPGSQDPTIIQLFANFSAGELPKDALIRQVRAAQTKRKSAVAPTTQPAAKTTQLSGEVTVVPEYR